MHESLQKVLLAMVELGREGECAGNSLVLEVRQMFNVSHGDELRIERWKMVFTRWSTYFCDVGILWFCH